MNSLWGFPMIASLLSVCMGFYSVRVLTLRFGFMVHRFGFAVRLVQDLRNEREGLGV